MAKKKQTEDDVSVVLGRHKQTGRRPRKEKTVDKRLEHLVKESEVWIRLVRESWFDPEDPLIRDAIGASERPGLPDKYSEAIRKMREVAAYAKVAEDELRNGMREAKRKLKGVS